MTIRPSSGQKLVFSKINKTQSFFNRPVQECLKVIITERNYNKNDVCFSPEHKIFDVVVVVVVVVVLGVVLVEKLKTLITIIIQNTSNLVLPLEFNGTEFVSGKKLNMDDTLHDL